LKEAAAFLAYVAPFTFEGFNIKNGEFAGVKSQFCGNNIDISEKP